MQCCNLESNKCKREKIPQTQMRNMTDRQPDEEYDRQMRNMTYR